MTVLRVGLLLAAAVAATVIANVVLLGVATGSGDPVGRLSPRAAIVSPPTKPAPPQTVVRPTRTGRERERDD